jgi:hypothetical protein
MIHLQVLHLGYVLKCNEPYRPFAFANSGSENGKIAHTSQASAKTGTKEQPNICFCGEKLKISL